MTTATAPLQAQALHAPEIYAEPTFSQAPQPTPPSAQVNSGREDLADGAAEGTATAESKGHDVSCGEHASVVGKKSVGVAHGDVLGDVPGDILDEESAEGVRRGESVDEESREFDGVGRQGGGGWRKEKERENEYAIVSLSVRDQRLTENEEEEEEEEEGEKGVGVVGVREEVQFYSSAMMDMSRNAAVCPPSIAAGVGGTGCVAAGMGERGCVAVGVGDWCASESSRSSGHAVMSDNSWQVADSNFSDLEQYDVMPIARVDVSRGTTPTTHERAVGGTVVRVEGGSDSSSADEEGQSEEGGVRGVEVWRQLKKIVSAGVGGGRGGHGDEKWLWRRLLLFMRSALLVFVMWRVCTKMVNVYLKLKEVGRVLFSQRHTVRSLQAVSHVARVSESHRTYE